MRMEFNVTGEQRKELVTALAGILETKAQYMRMPTMAYEVGPFTIDKDGAIETDAEIDEETMARILNSLAEQGFTTDDEPAEDTEYEEDGLTITVPLESAGLGNLINLLDAKGYLIKDALGIDDLPIRMEGETLSFPWFPEMPEADESVAYTEFIAAICKMSKEKKRISAAEHRADNEKYAFRCFLLRLGFIGDQYKTTRRILLRNLSGSSAWKNGAPQKEVQNADHQ